MNTYGAERVSEEDADVVRGKVSMRSNLVLTRRPDLLSAPEPEPIDEKASKKEQMDFVEQIQKRFEEAEKIPEEEFPIDFQLYRIWLEAAEKQQEEKEKEKFQKIIKDIYRYYGVSEEDKEKGSQRFLALAHILEEQ